MTTRTAFLGIDGTHYGSCPIELTPRVGEIVSFNYKGTCKVFQVTHVGHIINFLPMPYQEPKLGTMDSHPTHDAIVSTVVYIQEIDDTHGMYTANRFGTGKN